MKCIHGNWPLSLAGPVLELAWVSGATRPSDFRRGRNRDRSSYECCGNEKASLGNSERGLSDSIPLRRLT